MSKSIYDMSYKEMIEEIKRIEIALIKTKSPTQNRDYKKYLLKLKKEIAEYERFKR